MDFERATSEGYAFHSTSPENVDSITANGVHSNEQMEDSKTILSILRDLGYQNPFPFNRSQATYCYIDAEYVSSYSQELESSPLNSDEVFIVVDVDEIPSPTFVADMSVISDLIDYRFAGSSAMMYADSADEAVSLYKETIKPVSSKQDIRSTSWNSYNCPELVIDGDIPPSAIEGKVSGL